VCRVPQVGFCDGKSSTDTTRCAPCNFTSCKPLHILVNQCTGRSSVDTASCVPCTDSSEQGCSSNQFMGRMCSASSLYNGACQNCDVACISAAAKNSASPTGQYKLIPCTGLTSSNLVCANCRQNCAIGEYIANLCDGMGTKDSAMCEKCTCPDGQYAKNNLCMGNTTNNVLTCTQCTNASSCAEGYYLSGTCSNFSNTACTKCRSRCGAAEIEGSVCKERQKQVQDVNYSGRCFADSLLHTHTRTHTYTHTLDLRRICLPDVACFQDCPAGFFESRQCSPPNVVQQCTACKICPTGYYIQTPCSRNNDTECARCTSSICVSDEYNAQFSTSGGCQGTELQDSAMCGTIKESYGQRCAPNSYRVRNRINMPHAWGASALTPAAGPSHRALNDSRFNATLLRQPLLITSVNSSIPAELQPYLAFDVHPARKVYAYCSGNTILTYDYQGLQTGVFLDFAHVPEPCSDIRFTASGSI
jgi:hypothetical protein